MLILTACGRRVTQIQAKARTRQQQQRRKKAGHKTRKEEIPPGTITGKVQLTVTRQLEFLLIVVHRCMNLRSIRGAAMGTTHACVITNAD